MKVIIPVKDNSKRVPNKNFKSFFNNQSLFDLTVGKLLEVVNPCDIYMSCENEERKTLADRYGVNFILRDVELASNDTPFYDVFNGVCDQVPGSDDVAWCQVIDPMFNGYKECFDLWNNGYSSLNFGVPGIKNVKGSHDSLVVVYPDRGYYLDGSYSPEGFGFGRWHKKSQILPTKYHLTFTLSILTRDAIKKCGYYIGNSPFWYHAKNKHVDIDTESDFTLAQSMYGYFNENSDLPRQNV